MGKAFKKQIPYGHQSIDNKDIQEVIKVLKSDWITQGPKIGQFEKLLAQYVGAKYAVAVSSGTAALHLACLAANIGPGDEVIVPALSFIATANCILYCGAKPVLVDIHPDTLTVDVEKAEKKIAKKTKAIIAVDFAGHPADWNKLKTLAKKHKLTLIDDAAHALGSKYHNKMIGAIADLTCFSFHPVKTITTGEGGAIITDNKNYYEKLMTLRHHGIYKSKKLFKKFGPWYYQIKDLGYNFRMTDLQAALGISQLKKIDSFIVKRRKIWQRYNHAFENFKRLVLPKEKQGCFSAWHIYPLRLAPQLNRKKIFWGLKKAGVGVQVHYIPIHMFDLYKKRFGYKDGNFPKAEEYYNSEITLPIYYSLKDRQQTYIIRKLKETING